MRLNAGCIAKVAEGVLLGLSRESAARLVGIDPAVMAEWYGRGRHDAAAGVKSRCRTLYEAVSAAEAGCEAGHVANITRAGQTEWRASAWILEHTRPHRYGKQPPPPENEGSDDVVVIG